MLNFKAIVDNWLWRDESPRYKAEDDLACACYAFVRVCSYVPCGHLLGKG